MKLNTQTDIRAYYKRRRDREDQFWRNLAIAACVLSAMLLFWLEQLQAVANG